MMMITIMVVVMVMNRGDFSVACPFIITENKDCRRSEGRGQPLPPVCRGESARQQYRQHPCIQCGELFQTAIDLHQHRAYLCHSVQGSIDHPSHDGVDLSRKSPIVIEPLNSHSVTQTKDKQGILPLKSEVQEMIQDTQRTELPSPSQRAVHDLSTSQHTADLLNSKLSLVITVSDRHLNVSAPMISSLSVRVTARCLAVYECAYSGVMTTGRLFEDSWLGLGGRVNNGLSSLKQFPCENCDKVFSDPLQLQRHIRSLHVGARAHTCSDCGKTFATSSGLKQHQHIHSSIKPFQCEVCLKAYTQFSNLCRHKRMHADCRQQIKCKDCGQTFSTMTSLGKHKRFCQGMMTNGAGRIGFHSTATNLTAEKSSSLNSASKMSFAPNPYTSFYGPRAPFPFFPPVGASFPMFPSGHPVAAVMSANMSEKRYGHHDKERVDSRQDLVDSDSDERKPPRWPSDHSNVSTTSDLAKSDIESGSESEHNFRNGLCESPPSMKTSSPAMTSPMSGSGRSQPAFDLSRKRKRSGSFEKPFDLSRTLSPSGERHSDTKSESGYGGEQPLDLSYKSGKEDTPRKTHIFGKNDRREGLEQKVKVSPVTATVKSHSPVPVPAMFPKSKLSIDCPDKLHDAYPANSASHMMMNRMYGAAGVEKSNVDIYHEAARLMSMAPSRFVFPGMPSPFSPFSGALPTMFPSSPLDQAKSMGPGFMRGHTTPFPYAPGMKLKDRYTCKFCGKIFPRSANLTRHLRTHTGEQPYKCKYCERSFSISSNLQRHIRNIHNKEKPFKCPICDRCFGQQTNLDRHLKKHEYEGPVVADSPFNEEPDCDDVGTLNGGELGSTGSSGHGSELSSPNKDDKEAVVNSTFSITGRLMKVENKSHKRHNESSEHSEPELNWAEHTDGGDVEGEDGDMDDDDDEEEAAGEVDRKTSPTKKTKLLNNNLPENSFNHVVGLSNGSS
ncbi:hypothetical protein LSH36_244g04018 [Paralvinella palmiformis]|uniref:C2H2-type domain-containing protein n=1 Tax=Paralvinella palmiformis TaxID=53620 RepID=A0AAD9N515_9ANNE|nr:hypothetical protein LSH36_244g04018 [Paralvinella palmiformis]